MLQSLTHIKVNAPDWCHMIGQECLSLLITPFGNYYEVDSAVCKLPNQPLIKKIRWIVLAILLLPLTLIAGAIGAIVLHFSKTHKEAYKKIEDTFVSIIWNGDRPEIQTKHLLMRPIKDGDLANYKKLFLKVYQRYEYEPHSETSQGRNNTRGIENWFNCWLEYSREHSFFPFLIQDLVSHEVVGHAWVATGVDEGNPDMGISPIDIVFDPEYLPFNDLKGVSNEPRIEAIRASILYAKELKEKCELPSQIKNKDGNETEWTLLPLTQIKCKVLREYNAEYEAYRQVLAVENRGIETNVSQNNSALFILNLDP